MEIRNILVGWPRVFCEKGYFAGYTFLYTETLVDVFFRRVKVKDVSMKEELEKIIDRSFRDPVAALLLKNSNITTVQYESLIIDYVSEYIADKELTYNNKALLRSKKVSRGSFSRTLAQARRNIISSIYTILLLFYIGVFETPPFEEYKNMAEKLGEYLALIRMTEEPQAKQLLRRLEEELMRGIQSLADPKSLKTM